MTDIVPDPDLFSDGIDGSTGEPLYPPIPVAVAADLALGHAVDSRQVAEAKAWHRAATEPHLGSLEDPRDLAANGWGVIFARDADPAVREALQPLIDHRRATAGDRCRAYQGDGGYRPGEKKDEFLKRYGMGPTIADPEKIPYYLLLVGSPEEIPWAFQHQLDLQYAVGRLDLDSVEAYASYARTVVEMETSGASRPRRAVFFGVQNPGDAATQSLGRYLVEPLAGACAEDCAEEKPDWSVETVLGDAATKARLSRYLGGADTPALLFTACHGMGFPADDPRQLPHQGALLCSDWPGREAWKGPVPQDHYWAGDDVTAGAAPRGLIAFHYACHAAGTPQLDAYAQPGAPRRTLAPHAFAASLPKRLLGHPQGGALAVVGHVERTWGYSFLWKGVGRQTQTFESFFKQLFAGYPIGAALEAFALRYAEILALLDSLREDIDYGAPADPQQLSSLWTARNDARGYVLLGDPAVRL
jgi:hypothetical protein